MKTLILGSIPDDFDPRLHHPLGPWCFVGREEIFPNWKSLDFEPDPFSSPEDLHQASRSTSRYADQAVAEVGEYLNGVNGTDHSSKFWRLLLMPWLLYLVQTTWERQRRLEQFLQRYQGVRYRVTLVRDCDDWGFRDTLDFLNNGVLNTVYNEWLFSRLLEKRLPDTWEVTYVDKALGNALRTREKASWKRRAKELLYSRLRCFGVYGIGRVESIGWSLLLSIRPAQRSAISQDVVVREKSSPIIWWPDMRELMIKTMPLAFRTISERRRAGLKPKAGKVNVIGPVVYYGEHEKLFLAHRVEKGERLIVAQHGGNYGTLKTAPFHAELEYKQSCFFTWGWLNHEDYDGTFIPLPSPLLSRFKNKHRQKQDHLCLVGTFTNLLSYRLDSIPQPLQIINHQEEKSTFLRNLQPEILDKVFFRPYALEKGAIADRRFIEKRFDQIRILEGSLYERILKCKLAVVDHPVTTLSFALAANVPLIGFWDERAWVTSHQAAPFFEDLKKVGVLFNHAAQAADQVNRIWGDVSGWWGQQEIQMAREKWCFHFARTSSRWRGEWARTIWSI